MKIGRFILSELTREQRSAIAKKAIATMRAKRTGPFAPKSATNAAIGNSVRPARPAVSPYRSAYRKAEQEVRTKGAQTGIEHLVAHDAKGNLVGKNKGTRNFVGFPAGTEHLLNHPSSRLVFHHNHPSSTSLSFGDIKAASHTGTARVIAHGADGSKYSLSMTGRQKMALGSLSPGAEKLLASPGSMVAGDMLTSIKINALARNRAMHNAGLTTYRERLSPAQTAISKNNEEIIRKLRIAYEGIVQRGIPSDMHPRRIGRYLVLPMGAVGLSTAYRRKKQDQGTNT